MSEVSENREAAGLLLEPPETPKFKVAQKCPKSDFRGLPQK